MRSTLAAILAITATACGGPSARDATGTSPAEARSDASRSSGERTLFIQSAVEYADGTVTLPLHRGTSRGRDVYYVLLDSSSGKDASSRGINESQKLAHVRGTTAVQKVKKPEPGAL